MFNLKNLSDDELMKLCREEKDKDSQQAWDAFNEIYSRYYEFLYSLCHTRFYDSVEADIMFEKTWERVRKYPKYSFDKHKTVFATWLAKMARNVSVDIDNQRIKGDIVVEDIANIEVGDDGEDKSVPKDVELMTDALEALSEREKEVTLTYMEYDTGENKYLPRDVINTLCAKFNTTAPYLRKIKQRSLDFLRNYVESHR